MQTGNRNLGIRGILGNFFSGEPVVQNGKKSPAHKNPEIAHTEKTDLDDHCVVSGVVLSLWDHICGPREEKLWRKRNIPDYVLSINAPFTLQGQVGVMVDDEKDIDKETRAQLDRVDQKFLVLSQYFSLSLIFSAFYEEQWTTFALSFLWEISYLPKFLETHKIVKDRMTQLVNIYKKYCNESSQTKEDPKVSLQKLDKKIAKTLDQLNKLFSVTLRSDIKISQTLFGKSNLEQTTKTFLAQVLTSHLQTSCTVVVGSNEKIIAEWIDTLSFFLLPHQRNISRSKVESGKENFIPDLALQGIICTQEDITKKLRKTTSSTTLLILSPENSIAPLPNGEQPPPFGPTFNVNNSVKQYYPSTDNPIPRNDLRNSDEQYLRNAETSYEVNEIIEKIFKVEGNFVKQGYISQMMSLLMRKATVLLKYVESMPSNIDLTELPQDQKKDDLTPRDVESGPVSPRNLTEQSNPDLLMTRETKKRIRNDLGLREDSCFNLLLGIADKLKPGIYYTVVGNQAWIEEKLIELFERF